jgi:hypothetical protein
MNSGLLFFLSHAANFLLFKIHGLFFLARPSPVRPIFLAQQATSPSFLFLHSSPFSSSLEQRSRAAAACSTRQLTSVLRHSLSPATS